MPLHAILFKSHLVTGGVVVGVRPSLPLEGVSFVLGNDLAGGRILSSPVVTPVPLVRCPDERMQKYPGVFRACVVMRACPNAL